MEPLTIILVTIALAAVAGLCWIGGYELGAANGVRAERELADRRVRGLLDAENKRKPRTARKRRASK